MSEPIYSDPNPFAQNPVRNPDLVEPEPNSGDQMPPDPLLESGFFIDSDQKADADTKKTNREPDPGKPAAAETTTTTAPEATVPLEATPISQRRPRRPVEESAERPSWLPEGWTVEVRVRTSGATAGTTDRLFWAPIGPYLVQTLHCIDQACYSSQLFSAFGYPPYFFSPSGQKFRSKVEVLHFLETGSMRKRKLKSDADAKPSESPSDNRKKKSKPNIRNFSDLKFDFRNPPECLTWVQEDDCPDAWAPVTGNTTVPESIKTEWGTVFSHISQLDRSNGAS